MCRIDTEISVRVEIENMAELTTAAKEAANAITNLQVALVKLEAFGPKVSLEDQSSNN